MGIVHKYQPEKGFDTPERCRIVELLTVKHDKACSLALATVKPGVTTQLHSLKGTAERYFLLQGEGLVEVGDKEPVAVGEKDVVVIPADMSQRITNIGTSELVFLCVCTPPFEEESYVKLEE